MPRQVDHHERRREIAAAVVRIAGERGLHGVTFREVAGEAGVSVALVQHYFGTKENLLIGSLDIESAHLAGIIAVRIGELGPDAGPIEQVRAIARTFLGADPESRNAMLLYHSFGAVALTDPGLRQADAFRNSESLVQTLTTLLAAGQETGRVANDVDPDAEAWALLSLVLGLSFAVLLEQLPVTRAEAVLDAHLARLAPRHG